MGNRIQPNFKIRQETMIDPNNRHMTIKLGIYLDRETNHRRGIPLSMTGKCAIDVTSTEHNNMTVITVY